MLNIHLLNKVDELKNRMSILLRNKFKNIIIILNSILYKYLKSSNRDVNEELIYLYVIAIRQKKYIYIPNV